ncbi:unnamed protein product, partial [Rotaria sp. Silwood2]
QMTSRSLFQIIDHYIQDPKKPETVTTIKLNEKLQRKPINQQLQIKYRYDSFQTKAEKKRKKKIMKEQQERKNNDDDLDLDINDETDKLLLQRINSLKESNNKKIKTNDSKQITRSISFDLLKPEDEKTEFENDLRKPKVEQSISSETSQSSQILPVELKCEDTSNSLLATDNSNSSFTKDILPDNLSSNIIPITSDQSLEILCTDGNRQRTSSDGSSATVDYDFDTETCTALTSQSIDIDT